MGKKKLERRFFLEAVTKKMTQPQKCTTNTKCTILPNLHEIQAILPTEVMKKFHKDWPKIVALFVIVIFCVRFFCISLYDNLLKII